MNITPPTPYSDEFGLTLADTIISPLAPPIMVTQIENTWKEISNIILNFVNISGQIKIIYQRSSIAPAIPDPTDPHPPFWFDTLPNGTDILYLSIGIVDNETMRVSWSSPISVTTLSGLDASTLSGYTANLFTTPLTIPVRDINGFLPGSILGNAASATILQTARNIAFSGDATGQSLFDGSTDISVPLILNTVTVDKGGTGAITLSGILKGNGTSAITGNATTTDLPEGTNLYYTDTRANSFISTLKGIAGGLASLDSNGKLLTSQLPAISTNHVFVIDSQASMLSLSAVIGDIAIRTDLNKTYILANTPPSTLSNWTELLTSPSVISVNGFNGVVVLSTTDINEGTNLYFTNTRSITSPLTSFSAFSGTVTSSDSILTALEKLTFDKHIPVTLAINSGLTLSGQELAIGLPSTITGTSVNDFSLSTHTHALSLPIATDTILGAVLVNGHGLSIDPITGLISLAIGFFNAEYYYGANNSDSFLHFDEVDNQIQLFHSSGDYLLFTDTTTILHSQNNLQLENLIGSITFDTNITISSNASLYFKDQFLTTTISLSETSQTGLIGFSTATSIIGALNELKALPTSIPIASSSILGGIKVGTSLVIGLDGTLDVGTGGGYILPIASDSILGGIKIGTDFLIDLTGIISLNKDNLHADAFTYGLVLVGDGLKIDTSGALTINLGTGLEIGTGGVLNVVTGSSYTLPIATDTILGGIKIGNGLVIDSLTGIVTLSTTPLFSVYQLSTIDNSGQITFSITSTNSYLSLSDGTVTLSSNNAGTIDIGTTQFNILSNTILQFKDSNLTSAIPISETGAGGLSGFTASSIVGALNELKQTTLSLPIATISSLGIVQIGSGLAIDGSGILSNSYAIPISTTSSLGGIIVGDNLTIDTNGRLSANPGGYTLPVASTTILGGVKIDGTSITIDGSGVISASGGGGAFLPLSGGTLTGALTLSDRASSLSLSYSGSNAAAMVFENSTTSGSIIHINSVSTTSPAIWITNAAPAAILIDNPYGGTGILINNYTGYGIHIINNSNGGYAAFFEASAVAPSVKFGGGAGIILPYVATSPTFNLEQGYTYWDGINLNIYNGSNFVAVGGTYSLPIASTSVLGGIKIGSGLSINGSGVTSVTGFEPTLTKGDLLGTANQIILTGGNGLNAIIGSSITLSLPQEIASDSSPTFSELNLSSTSIKVAEMFTNKKYSGVPETEKFKWFFSYDVSTRIFTLTLSLASYYYVNGKKFTLPSVVLNFNAHANTTGLYFCYFDSTGTATVSSTPWDLLNTAQVALIYYTTSNNGGSADSFIDYELHGTVMDAADHYYDHTYNGTRYNSGGVIADYALNTDTLIGIQYSISSATYSDEDLNFASPTISAGGTYFLGYFTSTGDFNWTTTSTLPYFNDGTNIEYNPVGSGLVGVTGTNFFNYYVFLTNNNDTTKRVLILPGQAVYASLALAQTETIANLVLTSFPTKEYVAIAQITMRRDDGNSSTTYKADIEAVTKININLSNVTGFSGVHNNLSGRSDAAVHPITSLTGTTLGNIPYVNSFLSISELSGNITTTTKFLKSVGDGTLATIPSWATLDTLSVIENTNLYFTETRVLASLLTGYSTSLGTITSSDSILTAIEKLGYDKVAGYYTLPTASTTILGGVKIDGTSITINGSGVISSISNFLAIAQITTPSNPASGYDSLYFKSDDSIFTLSHNGAEYRIVRCSSGITFPPAPVFAEEFYNTSLDLWFKYNGTTWTSL